MTKMTFDERIKWLDHKGKVYEIRDYGEDKIIVWDVVTDGQVTTSQQEYFRMVTE